jgi:alkyl hydroperoxide reductase subunit AhpC
MQHSNRSSIRRLHLGVAALLAAVLLLPATHAGEEGDVVLPPGVKKGLTRIREANEVLKESQEAFYLTLKRQHLARYQKTLKDRDRELAAVRQLADRLNASTKRKLDKLEAQYERLGESYERAEGAKADRLDKQMAKLMKEIQPMRDQVTAIRRPITELEEAIDEEPKLQSHPLLGKKMPTLRGRSLKDGGMFDGKSVAGGYVILTFWRLEFRTADDIIKRLASATDTFDSPPIHLVAVNTDDARQAIAVAKWAQEHGVRESVGLDPKGRLARQFKEDGLATFVVDDKGIIRRRFNSTDYREVDDFLTFLHEAAAKQ